MLRLESYLSPFLFRYLSKYIKNIEANDLQLSLWGGDVVLNNLDFKLDALDNELGKFPLSFVSCHAEKLTIHVPWSRLASECVAVTLNTVECVLKLNCNKTLRKPPAPVVQKDDSSDQPSYVNTLLKKIKNNINLTIHNVIIKYVEEDIVLSVNMRSALYQGADELWRPAFVELTETAPVLRRIWELKDVTVCLDKQSSNGLIETIEDPLLFQTQFVFREHNVYLSPVSSKPLATKINLLIDQYELNISENQLPLFLHLLQLCYHLYYGNIEMSFEESEDFDDETDKSQNQGWASWAWSYVPPVLQYEVDHSVKDTIFSFAVYVRTILIRIKQSRPEYRKQFHCTHSEKIWRPLVEIFAEGLELKTVVKGLEFFSCVASLCNGVIRFLGGVPSCLNNQKMPYFENDTSILLANGGGEMLGFLANSLFDFRSPENNNSLFSYALTKESFFKSESFQNLNNLFFSQYLYVAVDGRNKADSDEIEFNEYLRNVTLTNIQEWDNCQEQSWKKFFIGGKSCNIQLNSYMFLCMDILKSWSSSDNLKPFQLASARKVAFPETLLNLLFVPTRSASFILRNIEIVISALCLQPSTYGEKAFSMISLLENSRFQFLVKHNKKCNTWLPAVLLSVPSSEITMIQPMYGSYLASYLANFDSPLLDLVKACNTKYEVNIPFFNMFLSCTKLATPTLDPLSSLLHPILTLKDFVLESSALQAKEMWKKHTDVLLSCTKFTLSELLAELSPQQLEIILHIFDSYSSMICMTKPAHEVFDVFEIKDIFHCVDTYVHVDFRNLCGELRQTIACLSVYGSLKSFQVYWHLSADTIIPIAQCSDSFSSMHCPDEFMDASQTASVEPLTLLPNFDDGKKSNTCCLSFYIKIPFSLNSNWCILFSIEQLFLNIDPQLLDIFSKVPSLPLVLLMPSVSFNNSAKHSVSKNQLMFAEAFKSTLVVQIQSKGGQLLCLTKSHSCLLKTYQNLPAVDIIRNCILQFKASALLVLLPSFSTCSGGFKPIRISTKLLEIGVAVNKCIEFGKLNVSVENAAVFSFFPDENYSFCGEYIVKPCSISCTCICKNSKELSSSFALHLDFESISVEASQPKFSVIVSILNALFHVKSSVQKHCYAKLKTSTNEHSESEHLCESRYNDVITEPKSNMYQSSEQNNDTVSSARNSRLPHFRPVENKLPFVVWLQCTLPRFVVSVSCNKQKKILFCVDDVSTCLDYQSVYLKLTMSLSSFDASPLILQNGNWVKSDALDLMFNPMFSVLPSFLQKFSIPKSDSSVYKTEAPAKPGKFLELTFTQALTSDYHQNIEKGFECQSSCSVATETSELNVPLNRNISEFICVVQPFDMLLCPKQLACLVDTFSPLFKLQNNDFLHQDSIAIKRKVVLPVLYVTINGARLFVPCLQPNTVSDDIIMFCCGVSVLNPYPQNPLSRVIISPSIYKQANSVGLLNCPGSLLEDRQFEVTFKDLSLGTAKYEDVCVYLKRSVSFLKNPALQWNMRKQLDFTEPIFHPIFEQFDLKVTYAPAVYHSSPECKVEMVCAPSLEVNFIACLIMHVTKSQFLLLSSMLRLWIMEFEIIAETTKSASNLQSLSSESKKQLSVQKDSGISVCDGQIFDARKVNSGSFKFIGDYLITAKKVEIFYYEFVNDDHVDLFCQLILDEPSFVCHVTSLQQKLMVQCHNGVFNVSSSELKSVNSVHGHDKLFLPFLLTLSGKCDEQTGVPFSLCTLTINDFLTSKANIKLVIGRPIKFLFNDCVVFSLLKIAKEAQHCAQVLPSSNTGTLNSVDKIGSFGFDCSQIVCEMQYQDHSLRCSFGKICLDCKSIASSFVGSATLSGISIRMQLSKNKFLPVLYPVTVNATFKYCRMELCSNFNMKLSLTTVKCAATTMSLIELPVVLDTLQEWYTCLCTLLEWNETPSTKQTQNIFWNKLDDLRKGQYTYITSSEDNLMPLPGQIMFFSNLSISTMSWCYSEPHAVKHVCVTPIPFTQSLGDGCGILCVLESYEECLATYISRKEFYVSETNYVDFMLFDDNTPFHEQVFSTLWRVSIHNNNRFQVSPLSLAASLNVEAIYESSHVPSVNMNISAPAFQLVITSFEEKFENVELNVTNVGTSIVLWNMGMNDAIKANIDATLALQTLEFHSLTWVPVLLPMSLQLTFLHSSSAVNIQCNTAKKVEIHVSQRIIHSLQYLSKFFAATQINPSLFLLENRTSKPILFGQALTNECIALADGKSTLYTWRSNKVEPMFHVSLDGLSVWSWSFAFSPYTQHAVCSVIDDSKSIVAHINRTNPHQYRVVFMGCTKISNHLGISLQVCLMIDGKPTFVYCSAHDTDKEFLFNIENVSTISVKFGDNTASESVFVHELLDSRECSKLLKFSADNEIVNAQVCCCKDGLTDVIAIMPLFIVRSYLPSLIILHVETRSCNTSDVVQLYGRGNQLCLNSLSPFATHHLTVQLDKKESPFDSTIPIHFSLKNTLHESADASTSPEDLVKFYPYNGSDYNEKEDEKWVEGDGRIQAKVSVQSKTMLVEIMPWCLLSNETALTFCVISSDNCESVVHPDELIIPHHFSGLFSLRSLDSSCSEWLTLSLNPKLDHPSRFDKLKLNYLPLNGFRSMVLKTQDCLIELTIRSSAYHGVRVITILPRWNFINMMLKMQPLRILPCVCDSLNNFKEENSVLTEDTGIVPLLCWQTEVVRELPVVVDIQSNVEKNEGSVTSTSHKTGSLFLCVEKKSSHLTHDGRFLSLSTLNARSFVPVHDDFLKRIVEFYSTVDKILLEQLLLTKHEHNGCYYIALSSIKKQKYALHNCTDLTLFLRECSGSENNTVIIALHPNSSMKYESAMDAELFPSCLRKCRSLRFQIREADEDSWTDFLLIIKETSTEVLLSSGALFFADVSPSADEVKISFRNSFDSVVESDVIPFSCNLNVTDLQIVLMDDCSNPLHSINIVQLLCSDIGISMSHHKENWLVKFSMNKLTIDNHLFPESDFPVFFSTFEENGDWLTCFATLNKNMMIDEIKVSAKTIELQSDSEFLQFLTQLLESYAGYFQFSENLKEKHANLNISSIVQNEVNAIANSFRCRSIVIHPIALMLSIQASLAINVSIHRSVISFSKFVCQDVDTFPSEIIQEFLRHYLAEIVYNAGWVLGSLDLLGNPASTLRSYAKGISDLVVLPYQGIVNGPTSFLGGFTKGMASFLFHFSAATLRSVTNVASGISRNLSAAPKQSHFSYPNINLKEGSSVENDVLNEEQHADIPQSSGSMSDLTKLLLGIVTKPIGSAAGLVSRTGETILHKTGLEEHKSVHYDSLTHSTKLYQNSLSKYISKIIQESNAASPLELMSLDCKIVCSKGVSFSAILILSPTSLYIFQLADDVLESSMLLKDITMCLEKRQGAENNVITVLHNAAEIPTETEADFNDKVASYLGVKTVASSESKYTQNLVKYTAEIKDYNNAEFFITYFEVSKQSAHKFDW